MPGRRDPGDLWIEARDVVRLLLQQALWDEQREVGVDVAGRLDAGVESGLHVLPEGIAIGTDDHAAANRGVVRELSLEDDVRVPARVVVAPVGDILRPELVFSQDAALCPPTGACS